MSRTFDRSTGWIVTRPVLAVLLLAALTGLAVLGYTDPERLTSILRADDPQQIESTGDLGETFESPPDVDPVNLADSHAIIVVESDSIFTPQGAHALRHVVDTLDALDYVSNVLWMDEVPILNIFGLPEPLFPRTDASVEQFAAAKEKALAHPLVRGQLLSADGRTLLLLVNFDWLYVASDEDVTSGLKRVCQQAAAESTDVQFEFGVTGRVPMYVTAVQTHEDNQLRYQLIGYGMIAVMAVILFRGLTAVLIVALAPSLGVFWTLGFIRFFDFQHNPFNDVVLPVLISLVGLTDGVHLMVQIRRNRAAGMKPKQAAREGIREVGLACGLTSLTTAIGFGSLSLAHHEVVREFGWCCVIGVVLTFVSVITSIPLACSTRLGRRVHVGHEKGIIDRQLGRISGLVDWVLRHTRLLGWLGVATTLACAAASMALRPDERRSNALGESSEATIAMRKMDRALGGLDFGYVNVHWSDKVPSDSPQVLDVIREVDELLADEPLIGHPLSIRNFIDALPGEGPPAERMSLLELLPPPLKRAFYTPEFRHAQVSFRTQDLGIAAYGPVFERVQEGLSRINHEHPGFRLYLSGEPVSRWENIYQIVIDLAKSLGSASLIIFAVLAIVYRSLRMGLISIVPNMFPLAVTGAFLVITGQTLELVSVCAFTVCLGIAVDDTIHFLTRYQMERESCESTNFAIRRAFTGVGTALIMTTIVLIAGFCTVLLSDSRDHAIFGRMATLTIAAALFGDLIFLPALLARFAPKREDDSKDDKAA